MSPNPPDGPWVPWRVYQQDREEDRADRLEVRREGREDTEKILAKIESLGKDLGDRVGALEGAAGQRSGMAKVGQTALVVTPILIAIFMAVLAWSATS